MFSIRSQESISFSQFNQQSSFSVLRVPKFTTNLRIPRDLCLRSRLFLLLLRVNYFTGMCFSQVSSSERNASEWRGEAKKKSETKRETKKNFRVCPVSTQREKSNKLPNENN